jgi:glyoxylase-like metal-dependent hydrolase (beta-lactamase superfamily II)
MFDRWSIERVFDQVNPGSMAARDPWRSGRMRPRHPITRVSWSAPGRCRSTPTRGIDLEANLPLAAHLTTLDQAAAHQRLRRRAPRRHHAVRHRQDRASVTDPGYFPGAATGILYDRLARFDIGPGNTLTARLEAIGYDLADVRTAVLSHLHQDHIDGLPELRDAAADVVSRQEWQFLQQPLGASRAAALPHPAPWAALAPHRACTNRRFRPGPVTAGHPLFGDGSLVLPPTPGHTSGSLSMLVRRPGRPWQLLVGDLTYDAHLLEHGHLPGVGSWTICRARCAG